MKSLHRYRIAAALLLIDLAMALASTSLAADGTSSDVDPAMTVQALYTKCMSNAALDQMFCAGFFTAALDDATVMGASASTQAYGMCPKTSVTVGAAAQAFKNWAQKHPEYWSQVRYLGVLLALQETWPCK
jgi:Rap1a immunity proteins